MAGAAIGGMVGVGIDMMEDHFASKKGGPTSGSGGGTAAGGAPNPDDDENNSAPNPKSQPQTESKTLYETRGIRQVKKDISAST